MCDMNFVPKAVKFTKEVASSLRLIFRKKEEVPGAFDFLSPTKETAQAKSSKA